MNLRKFKDALAYLRTASYASAFNGEPNTALIIGTEVPANETYRVTDEA